jgi:hypothetical protein
MSGPWTAKQYVNSYLEWDVPRRIVSYRNLWQLDDRRLPDPLGFYPYEPPAIDVWPMLITVQMSTQSIQRIDYESGLNPLYRCSYGMRTYLWVKDDSSEMVTESRDRLTTVVRASLLDRPSLNYLDDGSHDLLIDETTLGEEFSDITYVKGERAVAGSFISYTLSLNEPIVRQDIFVGTEEDPMSVSLNVDVLDR